MRAIVLELTAQEGYRITAHKALTLILTPAAVLKKSSLAKLEAEFGNRTFSTGDAATVMRISVRQVQRILKDALDEGNLQKTGRGSATRYTLKRKQGPS